MSEIWKVFSKGELQDLIGSETLERLAFLVPAIAPNFEPDAIFYKDTLATIFDAFAGPDAIADRKFRERFLNHLTPRQIDSLLQIAKITGSMLSFDQKVSKIAAKGWRDEHFCKAFLQALDLPNSLMPAQHSELDQQRIIDPPLVPLKTLKDYQYGVFLKASRKLSVANSRFVVQMPTGSGKTRTAMEVISSYLNDSNEGRVVVWLAHSEELCEQAYDGFLEVWNHIGKFPVRMVRCWGSGAKLPYDSKERAFIVGGFQKMYAMLNDNKVPFAELTSRIDVVIVDEAHKVLAPTYREVTKALVGDGTRVVGLTATPGRSAVDLDENRALAEFFFNEIVSIDSGRESVISYLRSRKVLSNVTYDPIYTELHFDLSESGRKYLEKFFELPAGILKTIGSSDVRNVEILKRLQQECDKGGQIIFFACNIEHSKFITAMLLYLGYKAAHVDGSTSRNRRHSIIEDFKSRTIQVVSNFGVLSTGFDAPKTDVVFISRPTASIVLYSQMVGRGLRGPAIGGTASCKIIDVKDNIAGFSDPDKVYDYFDEYFRKSE